MCFILFGSQLSREALSIYNTYLSDSATLPVNIDDTARVDEQALKTPQPDMFQKAQQQVRVMGQQARNYEQTKRGILTPASQFPPEKWEMTARYPDQSQSQIAVMGSQKTA